jgi:nucleoside-diphosphate-sugar epimerase
MPGVLVTGGCGFVGRHVIRHLVDDGTSDIWICDDLSTGRPPANWLGPPKETRGPRTTHDLDGARVICHIGDVRDFLRDEGLPKFSLLVHLASVVGGRATIEDDPLAVANDFAIDADVFFWATKNRPERMLYASSSAAYPIRKQSTTAVALKESYISFEGALEQPDMTYGWAKVTGEFFARLAAEKYGLHVACVRPFSGYGEDQDLSYPIPAIAERAARRYDPLAVWGSGLQGRDFVHVDDCVDAMFIALDRITDGSAVNIGTGILTNFLEVAALFAKIEGYTPDIRGTEGKPVGVHSRYADTSLMREILGWEPRISIQEGFERVLEAAHVRDRAS